MRLKLHHHFVGFLAALTLILAISAFMEHPAKAENGEDELYPEDIAQAQVSPEEEDSEAVKFSLIGIEYDSETDTACFVDANICIKLHKVKENPKGACAPAVLIPVANAHAENTLSQLTYGYVTLKQFSGYMATYGDYPQAHYEICRSSEKQTYGAFCGGPQEAEKLSVCTYVTEIRAEHVPYKE